MAGRPIAAVPNIFTTEGTGSLNNIPLLDADFSFLNSQNNDSAIGYVNYAVDTGVANTYVVTLTSPPSGYVAGMTIAVNILNTNTGASTINVSSLGSVSILMASGGALVGGELTAGTTISMVFNGTAFLLMDTAPALSVNLGTVVANQSVNCLGYATVSIVMGTGTPGLNLILNNVGLATPITIVLQNPSGGNVAIGVRGNNSSGGAMTVTAKLSTGTVATLSSAGFTMAAGGTYVLVGASFTSAIFFALN